MTTVEPHILHAHSLVDFLQGSSVTSTFEHHKKAHLEDQKVQHETFSVVINGNEVEGIDRSMKDLRDKVKDEHVNKLHRLNKEIFRVTEEKDFGWLIKHLMSPISALKGCQINFPETIFIKDSSATKGEGIIEFLAQNDKDGCLKMIIDKNKLRLYNLRNILTEVIRKRKILEHSDEIHEKNTEMFDMHEESDDELADRSISKLTDHQKTIKINLKIQDKIEKKLKRKQVEELMLEKITVNHDAAIYWYRDGRTKVATDNELAESLKLRSIDSFWKQIYCIQTIVRSKVGLGKPIFVKFVAPIDLNNPENMIEYDYKSFKAETSSSTEHYCLKQVLKMAFYIQKIHCYEIIAMKCDFLKDENDKIWFHHAEDIRARSISHMSKPIWMGKVQKEEMKEEFNYEDILQTHFSNINLKDSIPKKVDEQAFHKICTLMEKDFEGIKEANGLADSDLLSVDPHEKINNAAFRELRPKFKLKLKDFLTKQKKSGVLNNFSVPRSKSQGKANKKPLNSQNYFGKDNVMKLHKLYQMKRLKSSFQKLPLEKTKDAKTVILDLKSSSSKLKKNNDYQTFGRRSSNQLFHKLGKSTSFSKSPSLSMEKAKSSLNNSARYKKILNSLNESSYGSKDEIQRQMTDKFEKSKIKDMHSTINIRIANMNNTLCSTGSYESHGSSRLHQFSDYKKQTTYNSIRNLSFTKKMILQKNNDTLLDRTTISHPEGRGANNDSYQDVSKNDSSKSFLKRVVKTQLSRSKPWVCKYRDPFSQNKSSVMGYSDKKSRRTKCSTKIRTSISIK
ncbi:unnamed protein product [Moneuplotes crassus]|uniref:Uncharacterized protein n=1 Tax=Euplotes crassus TaxID=5936 RepID=A0AAD1XY09_EUPCR|nr:unnamed protein product [Moneuplotes crassus]